MPQTYRHNPVVEACILLEYKAAQGGGERAQLGDITAIRFPMGTGIGTHEGCRFLWLRLVGWDILALRRLQESVYEPQGLHRFDKRRFCIPPHRLALVLPHFELGRALDRTSCYQPAQPVDADSLRFLPGATQRPLRVEGLVYDKQQGRYLTWLLHDARVPMRTAATMPILPG